MATLEERIATLEAIEAIKRMKAHYALCADAKYTEDHRRKPQAEIDRIAWDQASVFTDDAVWDNGLFGRFEARSAICLFLRATPWKFSVHMFMNPLIEIHGETATGSNGRPDFPVTRGASRGTRQAAKLGRRFHRAHRRSRRRTRFVRPERACGSSRMTLQSFKASSGARKAISSASHMSIRNLLKLSGAISWRFTPPPPHRTR